MIYMIIWGVAPRVELACGDFATLGGYPDPKGLKTFSASQRLCASVLNPVNPVNPV